MSTTSPRPTSIRLFLADGTPDGIRIVEKSNWTGVASGQEIGPRRGCREVETGPRE